MKEIRRGNRIDTTTKLRQVIENTLEFLPEKERKDTVKKTCQRVFQALRIDVNREFEVLYEFMEKLPGALKPGGRVAILTFHSGEDRLVKKALKDGYKSGIYTDYAKDVIRPSAQECAQNGRAPPQKCAGRSGQIWKYNARCEMTSPLWVVRNKNAKDILESFKRNTKKKKFKVVRFIRV